MRIAHRLLLGLLGVFVVIGGAAGTVFYLLESAHEQRKLEFVGDLVAAQVFERLEAQMRSHQGPLRPDSLGEVTLPQGVRRIFLVNAAGAVRVASDPALRGRTLARGAPGCRECHAPGAPSSVPLGAVLRWARPLARKASCLECHGAGSAPLGCLVVDLELSGYLAEMTEEIVLGLLLLVAVFALVGGATFLLARRWVWRRIEALGAVMERFEGGDLAARVATAGRDEIGRVEAGFDRMAQSLQAREAEHAALTERLSAANEGLRRGEERIRRAYDTQRVLNDVLRLSHGEQPLDAVLQRSLELLLGIPWLTLEARGSVFLLEEGALVMHAQSGMHPDLLAACRRVPLGTCLCGRAAEQGRLVHASGVAEEHTTAYPGMAPHGHYCVPILSAGREVLGVLNLYLSAGHVANAAEVEFLTAVASTLAGVIRRRVAEERLRTSEQRFRTLAEAASDTIFILDRERRVVFVNGTGASLFRLTPGEVTGRGIADLFPAETLARLGGSVARVLATGEPLYREELFSLPAGELWLGTTLVALPGAGGAAAGVFGISRDVTAQHLAQAERERLIAELQRMLGVVSQSHQEWQGTFDGITDLVSILDAENRIVKVNRAYAAYFGAHPRDLVGRSCHEFCLGGHDPRVACPLVQESAAQGTVTEEVLDPRTGRIFRISIFPYASGDAGVDRFVHLAEDVTGDREREQRLIMSERLAALGQMASGIAHEVNNPLASIAGCAEALLSRLAQGRSDPAVFKEYLGIIHEEVFRCKRITTAMLSFVRPGTYESGPVQLDGVVDRALELVGFQGRLRSVEVVRDYQEALPAVGASEGELRQVLLIVLSNALDAMADQGRLRCSIRAAGGRVTVAIADSGPGIPPEETGKLFTPFHTTKAERGGTGLGLSIARRIVEDHQGTIRIESRPGEGATVSISLPAL